MRIAELVKKEIHTPYMEAWIKDANEFEIPFQTQKGIIFLIGFSMRSEVNQSDFISYIDHTRRLSPKINYQKPCIDIEDGGDFNDGKIENILAEFAFKIMPEFIPRLIGGNREEQYTVWNTDGSNLLPEKFNKDTYQLSVWEETLTIICDEIGSQINMDLEGAYLAGFIFFDAYYPLDNKATLQIAQLISTFRPPTHMWLRKIIDFDDLSEAEICPMVKVLSSFISNIEEECKSLYTAVINSSNQFHYDKDGKYCPNAWDIDLIGMADFLATVSYEIDLKDEVFKGIHEYLKSTGREPPPFCKSKDEALVNILSSIYRYWGFDLSEDSQGLQVGQNYLRRSCIIFVHMLNSFLNPGWNNYPKDHEAE